MTYNNKKIVLERIKNVVDPEMLMSKLGFQITGKNNREIRARCKIHGGTNKTSFVMSRVFKKWVCFSNSCEEEFGKDVVGLIRSATRCSFTEALDMLSYMTGISLDEEIDEKTYNKFVAETEKAHLVNENKIVNLEDKELPVDISDYFSKMSKTNSKDYFIKRGFTQEVLDYFGISGVYFDFKGVERAVIPVHDANDRLVGVQGRRMDGVESDDKYRTERFKKGNILYNLNNAKEFSGELKTLILVEGVTDAWSLWMMDYYNAVSSLGCKITKEQALLILKYALNLIVIFDGDEEGKKSADRVENILGKTVNIYKIDLPEGKDPSSGDKNWLDGKLRSIYKEIT